MVVSAESREPGPQRSVCGHGPSVATLTASGPWSQVEESGYRGGWKGLQDALCCFVTERTDRNQRKKDGVSTSVRAEGPGESGPGVCEASQSGRRTRKHC